ncbi:hypothetical protein [Pseudooceanicola nanhaiensis]|uniref:hypothetical protein n=1 Tax=Pseudooceanicola nanhaiensis TaxID=375761 RepID=UPI001CD3FBED|nr:hypothetical protein [Pseudooceanicola nanhaiensis]MCA0922961.1 hypothetical protein [Pseudooceanicola nanhaiensis]
MERIILVAVGIVAGVLGYFAIFDRGLGPAPTVEGGVTISPPTFRSVLTVATLHADSFVIARMPGPSVGGRDYTANYMISWKDTVQLGVDFAGYDWDEEISKEERIDGILEVSAVLPDLKVQFPNTGAEPHGRFLSKTLGDRDEELPEIAKKFVQQVQDCVRQSVWADPGVVSHAVEQIENMFRVGAPSGVTVKFNLAFANEAFIDSNVATARAAASNGCSHIEDWND